MDTIESLYLRFFHAIPDVLEVEVYINDIFISKLNYRGFTEYYPGRNGTYKIQIFLPTDRTTPLYEEQVVLDKDIYTFALTGTKEDFSSNLIRSEPIKADPNKAIIRFANLAPFNTEYDIFINNKNAVDNLHYEDLTFFFSLNPGKYYLKATDSMTGALKLQDPNMNLKKGKIYTGYIVGLDGGKPGLQILLPLEGATYIKY